MLTTISNLLNTIITTDVNAHSLLWYSPTEDNRGELIKDKHLNSHHITLNTKLQHVYHPIKYNSLLHQTSLQLKQTCMTALAGTPLHQIHSLTSDHLPLLTTLTIHHKTKTTHSHFTKTITN